MTSTVQPRHVERQDRHGQAAAPIDSYGCETMTTHSSNRTSPLEVRLTGHPVPALPTRPRHVCRSVAASSRARVSPAASQHVRLGCERPREVGRCRVAARRWCSDSGAEQVSNLGEKKDLFSLFLLLIFGSMTS